MSFFELFFVLLVFSVFALAASSVVGGIFAGLTSGSTHVRWFLPTIAYVVGSILFLTVLKPGEWKVWHPLVGWLLLILVIQGMGDLDRENRRTRSKIWCDAVAKSTLILTGVAATILVSMDHHHG